MMTFFLGITTIVSVEFFIVILICIFGGNKKW